MAKNAPKEITETENEGEQLSESYISIGLGLLVVVVVGILLYNYFTQKNAKPAPEASPSENIAQEATMSAKPGSTYTVVEGDTLWSIAVKSYNDGYKWPEIAKANNLSNTDQLEAGQQLKIPEVSPAPAASDIAMTAVSPSPVASVEASATPQPSASSQLESPILAVSPSPEASVVPSATPETAMVKPVVTPAPTSITGGSYTIVHGDTLWDIACRAYGDCYAWTKIAAANKLEHPDLIHAGNVLTLPR